MLNLNDNLPLEKEVSDSNMRYFVTYYTVGKRQKMYLSGNTDGNWPDSAWLNKQLLYYNANSKDINILHTFEVTEQEMEQLKSLPDSSLSN